MKKWLVLLLLLVAVALYLGRHWLAEFLAPLSIFVSAWRTVWGSFANVAAILAGLPQGVLVVVAAFAVVIALATMSLAGLIKIKRQPAARPSARPVDMVFNRDPRGALRGTLDRVERQGDGSYRARTTDRQERWMRDQAERQGMSARRDE